MHKGQRDDYNKGATSSLQAFLEYLGFRKEKTHWGSQRFAPATEEPPYVRKVNIEDDLRDQEVDSDYFSGDQEHNEIYASNEQDQLGNRGLTPSVSKSALRKTPTKDNPNNQEHQPALSKEASNVILHELETWERKRHTLRNRKKKTSMSCTSAISSVYSAWRRYQEEKEYLELRKRCGRGVFDDLKAFIDNEDHHSTKANNMHNSIKTHCNPTSILGYVSMRENSLLE